MPAPPSSDKKMLAVLGRIEALEGDTAQGIAQVQALLENTAPEINQLKTQVKEQTKLLRNIHKSLTTGDQVGLGSTLSQESQSFKSIASAIDIMANASQKTSGDQMKDIFRGVSMGLSKMVESIPPTEMRAVSEAVLVLSENIVGFAEGIEQVGRMTAVEAGAVRFGRVMAKILKGMSGISDENQEEMNLKDKAAQVQALTALGSGISGFLTSLIKISTLGPLIMPGAKKFGKIVHTLIEGVAGGDEGEIQQARSSLEALSALGTGVIQFVSGLAVLPVLAPLVLTGALVFRGVLAILRPVLNRLEGEGFAQEDKTLTLIKMSLGIMAFSTTMVLALPLMAVANITALLFWMTTILLQRGFDRLNSKQTRRGTLALIAIAGSIAFLGLSLAIWPTLGIDFSTLALVGTAVVGLGVAMFIAGKQFGNILKGSLAMLVASTSILVLGAAMSVWTSAGVTMGDVGVLSLTIVSVGLTMALAGAVASFIAMGAGAMIVAGAATLILSFAMVVWTSAGVTMEDVGVLAATITSVGIVMGIAGAAAGFIAAGAVSIILSSAALLVLAPAVRAFKEISFTKEDSEKLGSTISSVGFSFAKIGPFSPFIMMGATTMMMAGGALISIAEGIKKFADMGIPMNSLVGEDGKITMVLTAVSDAFADIGKRGGFLGFNNPVSNGVAAVQGMGDVLMNIAKGVQKFANLEFTDSEGNTVKLSNAKLDQTTNNIKKVITTVSSAFAEVAGMSKKKQMGGIFGGISNAVFGSAEYSTSKVAQGIDAVSGMGTILANLAKGVRAFATMRFTNEAGETVRITPAHLEKVGVSINKVIGSLSGAFAKVADRTKNKKVGGLLGGVSQSLFGTNQYSVNKVEQGVDAVSGMGSIVANLAEGVKGFATMQFKDEDGKKVKITEKQLVQVSQKIGKVIETISKSFATIGRKSESVDTDSIGGALIYGGSKDVNMVKKGINASEGMGKIVSGLAKGISEFAKLTKGGAKDPESGEKIKFNRQQVISNIQAVIGAVSTALANSAGALKSVPEESITALKQSSGAILDIGKAASKFSQATKGSSKDQMSQIPQMVKNTLDVVWMGDEKSGAVKQSVNELASFANSVKLLSQNSSGMKNLPKNFAGFKKNLNALDLKKVESTSDLLHTLQELSSLEGGMDKLSSKIGQSLDQGFTKLAELLEELTGVQEETKKKMDEGAQNTNRFAASQEQAEEGKEVKKERERQEQQNQMSQKSLQEIAALLEEVRSALESKLDVRIVDDAGVFEGMNE